MEEGDRGKQRATEARAVRKCGAAESAASSMDAQDSMDGSPFFHAPRSLSGDIEPDERSRQLGRDLANVRNSGGRQPRGWKNASIASGGAPEALRQSHGEIRVWRCTRNWRRTSRDSVGFLRVASPPVHRTRSMDDWSTRRQQQQQEQTCHISRLPDELLVDILLHLAAFKLLPSTRERRNAFLGVCPVFRRLATIGQQLLCLELSVKRHNEREMRQLVGADGGAGASLAARVCRALDVDEGGDASASLVNATHWTTCLPSVKELSVRGASSLSLDELADFQSASLPPSCPDRTHSPTELTRSQSCVASASTNRRCRRRGSPPASATSSR